MQGSGNGISFGSFLRSAIAAGSLCLTANLAQAEESPDTLKKIAETRTIVIGHRQNEIPFSYVRDGHPIGYSIELCERIVQALETTLQLDKIKIEYLPTTTATRFVLMRAGKMDMECAETTNNAERRKIVDFSLPHFLTATRFVSLKSSHMSTIADLSGRSVASTTGTVNIEQLNAVNRGRNLNISVMINKEHKDSFAMVESGRASAFVMDDVLLAGLVAVSADPSKFEISREALNRPEPYGLMLPAKDEAFKTAVNDALRQLFVSGEIRKIYEKWFMSPIPPAGLNMHLPMSPELEALFATPQEYKD
ncbi:amino acid ABC transporter substrate-binding protein [Rhizobium oryzicola]|uniref:Amino acid ABC transporter substrate-binding protein n=1 Tax=Rhizobium oryzicola TaxID=1232668 RepID=A0ABT8T0A8_9HYPH|nr:amino acid ABC transporter substrate-binding protein [Rhizobium oryzicola]MDO1583327.1 amino acid ABC transporter substrate-binding protein [Rhizobium oryzicola]